MRNSAGKQRLTGNGSRLHEAGNHPPWRTQGSRNRLQSPWRGIRRDRRPAVSAVGRLVVLGGRIALRAGDATDMLPFFSDDAESCDVYGFRTGKLFLFLRYVAEEKTAWSGRRDVSAVPACSRRDGPKVRGKGAVGVSDGRRGCRRRHDSFTSRGRLAQEI